MCQQDDPDISVLRQFMPKPTADPPTPPTLAARLSDEVLRRAVEAYEGSEHFEDVNARLKNGAEVSVQEQDMAERRALDDLRAVLVAALTPEPVTPPVAVPVLHIPPDIAKGSAVATPPTPAPKQEPTVRLSKTFDITSEKLPTLTGPPLSLTATLRESFSAPADDARGLAVDMLDFDRLDRYADGVVDASAVAWLEDFRVRLQRNIGEVLSLREDYRKQRKEILTLQVEHEYERAAANELREIVEELRKEARR